MERTTVGHDGVDADGVPGTWEGVPNGSLGLDDGQTEVGHEAVNDVQILGDLPAGILFVNVGCMRFKEVNLTDANEGTRLLGFIAEGVDHLVNLQWEVLVGTNPQREHRVHRRLRCWTKEHRDVEVVLAGVLYPVDFFLEAAFFVLIPKVVGVNAFFSGSLQTSDEGVFLFKKVFRNK